MNAPDRMPDGNSAAEFLHDIATMARDRLAPVSEERENWLNSWTENKLRHMKRGETLEAFFDAMGRKGFDHSKAMLCAADNDAAALGQMVIDALFDHFRRDAEAEFDDTDWVTYRREEWV